MLLKRRRKEEKKIIVPNTVSLSYNATQKVFRLVKLTRTDPDKFEEDIRHLREKIQRKIEKLKETGENSEFILFHDIIDLAMRYVKCGNAMTFPLVIARGVNSDGHCIHLAYDMKASYQISKLTSKKRLNPNTFLKVLKSEWLLHIELAKKLFPLIACEFSARLVEHGLKNAFFNPQKVRNIDFATVRFDYQSPNLSDEAKAELVEQQRSLEEKVDKETVVKHENKEIKNTYEFAYNRETFELTLIIKVPGIYKKRENITDLLELIKGQGRALVKAGKGGNYKFASKEVADMIASEVKQEKIEIVVLRGEANRESSVELSLSTDKMYLYITSLEQAKGSAKKLQVEGVIEEIRYLNIKEGLKAAVHNVQNSLDIVNLGKELPPDFVVCRGVDRVNGENSRLDLVYQKRKKKGKTLSGGRIDMREHAASGVVRKGDIVARIIPSTKGKPGCNVLGELVKAMDGKDLKLQLGQGVRIGDDKVSIIAKCDGIPEVDGTSIDINQAYIIEGSVNFKTGNVKFDGNLVIRGSVDNGATVEASGDIEIGGYIEGGNVKSGATISVQKGIIGGQKSEVYAKGAITAEFVENSNVISETCVDIVESISNSHVAARGHIFCKSGRGLIRGGKIFAALVECNYLGAKTGSVTEIDAGVDFLYEKRLESLVVEQKSVTSDVEINRKQLKTVRNQRAINVGSLTKEQKIVELEQKNAALEKDLLAVQAKISNMRDNRPELSHSYVKVFETLSTNIRLRLNDKNAVITKELMSVGFKYSPSTKKVQMLSVEEISSVDVGAEPSAPTSGNEKESKNLEDAS